MFWDESNNKQDILIPFSSLFSFLHKSIFIMKYLSTILIYVLLIGCKGNAEFVEKGKADIHLKLKNPGSILTLGKDGLDCGNYIIPVSDGGYMVAGYVSTDEEQSYKGLLVRLDTKADTLWSKQYGGDGDNRIWSVAETPNGDFMLTGFSNNFSESNDQNVWLFRVDKNGKLLWEKDFGGSEDDLAWDIKRTRDNNYVISAQTASKGLGNFDAWILKVNNNGELLWDKTYGTEGRERIFSITEGKEGIIYATGIHTPGPAEGPIDVYTLAVNSEDGTLIWEDIMDKGGDDTGHGVIFDKRGGVWVTGYTTSVGEGEQDGFLARYVDGSLSNFFTYGGARKDRIMNVVHGEKDELWLVGYSNSYNKEGDNFDIWVSKTNISGEQLANFNFEGNGNDRGVHLMADSKNIIVTGTYVTTAMENDSDFIVLKLEES